MKHKISSIVLTVLVIIGTFIIVLAKMRECYKIDPEKCNFCGECVEVCEDESISPGKVGGKEVHIIDPQKCTGCGNCFEVCPEEAIFLEKEEIKGKEKGKKGREAEKAKKSKTK